MTKWSEDELHHIAETDDLHIAPFREDGVTYGTPTWIWSVTVGDALYVRGYIGQSLSLVPGRGAPEGRANYRRRHDEGGHLRAGRWSDE